jgi:DNA modification methylase
VAKGFEKGEAAAYAIADNQLTVAGGHAVREMWDLQSLAVTLQELQVGEGLDGTGFDGSSLEKLLDELRQKEPVKDETFDVAAALEAGVESRIKRGELWCLGKHRLMCGDSTSATDMARLMGDSRVPLVITDPPYGINLVPTNRKHRPIANDDLEGAELQSFLAKAFMRAVAHCTEDCSWYVWHGSTTQRAFVRALERAGVEVHQEIVWVKERFQLGRADYHWQHEPCLYGWGKKHRFRGGRTQSTIWEVTRARNQDHPTTKPVELYTRAMGNHLDLGEPCLDMFLGSGTALIAAEREGCRCFGMEIDPLYCEVAMQRWEAYTGQEAVRVDVG